MLEVEFKPEVKQVIDSIIDKVVSLNLAKVVHRTADNKYYFGEWCYEHHEELEGLHGDSGATKMVFLSDDLDEWVIKVPFLFSPDIAPGSKGYEDFCYAEMEVYEEAEKEGLAQYFAPTYFYTIVDDIPFYVQKRAECNSDINEDVFFSYCSNSYDREDFESEDDYYSAVNDDAEYMEDCDRLSAIFGGWITKLINFFDDRGIGDFHAGNFGFINNEPVLIDYSGY